MKFRPDIRGRHFVVLTIIVSLMCGASLSAQMIEADVSVNAELLSPDMQDDLAGFAGEVERYLEDTPWWRGEWVGSPVRISIDIFFNGARDNGAMTAQLVVVSQRDLYKSKEVSPVMRIFDDQWDFSYGRSQVLRRNTASYDPITSLLDFYVYIALGFDLDTYGYLGGSEMFEEAASIARRGELETSSGRARGWARDETGGGGYSRYNLVNELSNSRFFPIRRWMLDYHYNGLDRLSEYPDRALDSIRSYIDDLVVVKNDIVSGSTLIRMINDAKHREFADLFRGTTDGSIWAKLLFLDPTHQSVYEEARDGR